MQDEIFKYCFKKKFSTSNNFSQIYLCSFTFQKSIVCEKRPKSLSATSMLNIKLPEIETKKKCNALSRLNCEFPSLYCTLYPLPNHTSWLEMAWRK